MPQGWRPPLHYVVMALYLSPHCGLVVTKGCDAFTSLAHRQTQEQRKARLATFCRCRGAATAGPLHSTAPPHAHNPHTHTTGLDLTQKQSLPLWLCSPRAKTKLDICNMVPIFLLALRRQKRHNRACISPSTSRSPICPPPYAQAGHYPAVIFVQVLGSPNVAP